MRIEHLEGTAEIQREDELTCVLKIRTIQNENEFWISRDREFPCLVMAVSDKYAVLHYFPKEGAAGFQSLGCCADIENRSFCWHTTNKELCFLPFRYVLPVHKAEEAVLEFMKTNEMPCVILWESLEE